MKTKYISYEDSILKLNLESLQQRRRSLLERFGETGLKSNTLTDLFPINTKQHNMKTRNCEKYEVKLAHTERLKKSTILTLQSHLNIEERKKISEVKSRLI